MIDDLIDEFDQNLRQKQANEFQLLELEKAMQVFDHSQSALMSDIQHQTFLTLNTEE